MSDLAGSHSLDILSKGNRRVREDGPLTFWPGKRGQWEPTELFTQETPLSELANLIPPFIPQTLTRQLLCARSYFRYRDPNTFILSLSALTG